MTVFLLLLRPQPQPQPPLLSLSSSKSKSIRRMRMKCPHYLAPITTLHGTMSNRRCVLNILQQIWSSSSDSSTRLWSSRPFRRPNQILPPPTQQHPPPPSLLSLSASTSLSQTLRPFEKMNHRYHRWYQSNHNHQRKCFVSTSSFIRTPEATSTATNSNNPDENQNTETVIPDS